MRISPNRPIDSAMKTYADAVKACGEYSIANPKCAIKDNPHTKAVDFAHRVALGSVRTLMVCPCNKVTPEITKDLRTACCNSDTINMHIHGR